MNEYNLVERITLNPQVLNGQPVIRGTQVLVEQVLGLLEIGETFQTIIEKHPGLEKEDIQACLVYARQLVQRERTQQCQPRSLEDLQSALPQILEQAPYIKLLVLFGSRARGDYNEKSDWDLAFLCDEELRKQYEKRGWDAYRIWGILQNAYNLGDDQIDAIEMKDCSDILAHNIAQDGQIIYEQNLGEFTHFCQEKIITPAEMKQLRKEMRERLRQKIQELQ